MSEAFSHNGAGATFTVGQVAEGVGVTVRTLHHYDEIGLLTPSARTEAGYRLYTASDIDRLRSIVLHRDLGMALEQIRAVLDAPDFDRRAALLQHRRALLARLAETEHLLAAVDDLLAQPHGDDTMQPSTDLFDGFDPEAHAAEARGRWGGTDAFRVARERTGSYTAADWQAMKSEAEDIVRQLAELRAAGAAPDSPGAGELAEAHRLHIERWFYPCTPAMHRGLAEMYLADERFTAHFDAYGPGTAEYLVAAIRAAGDDASG